MALFAIGDPHLSLGCNKPMDIFKGWENYLTRLTESWNTVVAPNDTVVVAGDISWASSLEEALPDFEYLHSQLNGTKLILKGNHDYWFSTKAKCDAFLESNGFDSIKIFFNNAFLCDGIAVCGTRGWVNEQGEVSQSDKKVILREAGRLRISLEAGKALGGVPVVFMHYPPAYYLYKSPEIIAALKEYDVKHCYYGHIHGSGLQYAIDGIFEGIDLHPVPCDYVDFTPRLVKL